MLLTTESSLKLYCIFYWKSIDHKCMAVFLISGFSPVFFYGPELLMCHFCSVINLFICISTLFSSIVFIWPINFIYWSYLYYHIFIFIVYFQFRKSLPSDFTDWFLKMFRVILFLCISRWILKYIYLFLLKILLVIIWTSPNLSFSEICLLISDIFFCKYGEVSALL